MLRYILLSLGIYVLYKLVFDIIIPVFRTSRQIQKQFRNMQQQMHEERDATTTQAFTSPRNAPQEKKAPADDYIDFEEIK